MNNFDANPGEAARIRRFVGRVETHEIMQLIRSSKLRIRQVVIPTGEEIPTHDAEEEVVLHGFQNRVSLNALSKTYELTDDELLCLKINEPFSTKAVENSSLLMIVLAPKQGDSVDLIGN